MKRRILYFLACLFLIGMMVMSGNAIDIRPSGSGTSTTNADSIKTKPIDTPAAGDDGEYMMYDHGTGTIQFNAPSGSGDITGVTAGNGLHGGGESGDVTIDLDTAKVRAVADTAINDSNQANWDKWVQTDAEINAAETDPTLTDDGTVQLFDGGWGEDTLVFNTTDADGRIYYRGTTPAQFFFTTQCSVASHLYVNGVGALNSNLYINYDGADGDAFLYFYDNSSATGESISWDDDPGEFDVSDDVNVTGSITSDGTIEGATLTEGGNAVYNSTETPGGELGGTWASPTVDDGIHDDEYVEVGDNFVGDVTGPYTATVIANNSVDGTDIALGSDAEGDVMYYNGTDWTRLAKGTAGQVLEMNAGATAPEWDTDDVGGSADSNWSEASVDGRFTVGALADSAGQIILYSADGTDSLRITVADGVVTSMANQVVAVDTVYAVEYFRGTRAGGEPAESVLVTIETVKDSLGNYYTQAHIDANFQPLEATLTDIADGTIAENLVNTDNPWADDEVANDITASNYLPLAGGTLAGDVDAGDGDIHNIEQMDCDTISINSEKFSDLTGGGLNVSGANALEVTWEDAIDFDASGALNTGSVADNEIDYSAVTFGDFDYQTAWRLFYSNTDGDVTELALGSSGEYLKSNGASSAPTWATPSGAGTQDSSYFNDGAAMYGPYLNDHWRIKESTGMAITREDSTDYDVFQFATTLGTSVDLTAEVTGTLPEANGGTGDTDLDDIIGGDGIEVTDGANAIIAGDATIKVLTGRTTTIDNDTVLVDTAGTFVWEGSHSFAGSGDINLPDNSVDNADMNDNSVDSDEYVDGSIDLVHLAAGVYAKDIVTTAPVTGATDNVLVGADSDVTLALDFTAAWDFGGATSVEIPNGTGPDCDAEGEIAWDTDDDGFSVNDGTDTVFIPMKDDKAAQVVSPDGAAGPRPLFHVNAEKYPHGIKIVHVEYALSASATYWVTFHEYSSAFAFQSVIDSIADTDTYIEDQTISDGDIDADDWVYFDYDSDDIDWVHVTVIFWVKEGD